MSYQPPQNPQQPWQHGTTQQFAPVPRPKSRGRLPYILGGVGAVLLLCVGGTTIAAVAGGDDEKSFADGYAQGVAAGRAEQSAAPAAPATTGAVPASPTAAASTATVVSTATAVSTPSAKPTKRAPTTRPATAAPSRIKVPDGVGENYQAAQDLWRSAGLIVAPAVDATGANRLPLIDSNWVVLSQDLEAGSKVEAGSVITATVKKYTDD